MTTAPGRIVSDPAAASSPNSYPELLAVRVIVAAIGLDKEEIFLLNAENIGTRINKIIINAIGSENKKDLDIHSIRKNYSQEIFMVREIKDLEMKTLIGHSTKSDTTDKHYLRGKRDHKALKVLVDKADFSKYFD